MHTQVSVSEAKADFSVLVERVQLGEEVVITKAGRPIAKIVPIRSMMAVRETGTAKSDIWMGDDFDDPLPSDLLGNLG
jgi:prevent-host-death family protein